jgi:hypothetical protein
LQPQFTRFSLFSAFRVIHWRTPVSYVPAQFRSNYDRKVSMFVTDDGGQPLSWRSVLVSGFVEHDSTEFAVVQTDPAVGRPDSLAKPGRRPTDVLRLSS